MKKTPKKHISELSFEEGMSAVLKADKKQVDKKIKKTSTKRRLKK